MPLKLHKRRRGAILQTTSAAVAAIMLLAIPLAAADDDVIVAASYDEWYPLDPDSMVATFDDASPSLSAPIPACSAPGTLTPTAMGFDWEEPSDQRGCGTASFDVTAPAGSRVAEVSFQASRDLESTGIPLRVNADQDLLVRDARNVIFGVNPYYNRTLEKAELQPHDLSFDIDGAANPVTISWSFADRGESAGQQLSLGTSGTAYSAEVQSMAVYYPSIPLPGHALTNMSEVEANNETISTRIIALQLPEPSGALAQRTVQVTVSKSFEFVGVRLPTGRFLESAALNVTDTPSSRIIRVHAGIVDEGGPGNYSFTFRSSVPMPVVVTRDASHHMPWLPWATASVPVVALGVAFPTLGIRKARARHAQLAWRNLWAIVIIAAMVALGAVAVAFALPRGQLTLLPLSIAAATVHAQWVGSGVVILAAVAVGSRQVQRALKAETDRERTEREAMERINQELERFAYVASHDLQEPLRKIISLTQLVQERYKGQLDDDADEFLGYAATSAVRMRDLVQDLLRYSRLDSEPVVKKRIDAGKAVEDVLSDLEKMMDDASAEVHCDPIPALMGHPGQFRQVVQNIISNGIKYRHPNRSPTVTITATQEGKFVHLQVTDNGIGIEPRHQARIFDIFQRLHSQAQFTGTGIGLSLVRKIVDRHGGRAWVESDGSTGSTFHVEWPVWRGA